MRLTRLLLAVAVAAPLAAQQPDTARMPRMPMGQMMPGALGPMMGEMGEMMGQMMRGMAFSPGHLLSHKDALHLTDQQVAKLTALRDAAEARHGAAMTEMRTHARAMSAAMAAATPDTAQVKVHNQAAGAAMMQGHWAMLSAATQARALLTETQRARVEGWADVMEQMMPMMERHGPGMMMR